MLTSADNQERHRVQRPRRHAPPLDRPRRPCCPLASLCPRREICVLSLDICRARLIVSKLILVYCIWICANDMRLD